MPRVTVDLAISPSDYMLFYGGHIKQVVARTPEGRTVRFPANILQHVVGHEGIYGRFDIDFDDQGRFLSISRV